MAWQNKNMKKYLFLCITLLFVPFFVFGQETNETSELPVEEITTETVDSQKFEEFIMSDSVDDGVNKEAETGVDCFDYYKFPSVQVNVQSKFSDYEIAHQKVSFVGEIINETELPINNGVLFVRIGRINEDIIEYNYIVEEKIALDNIFLNPSENKKIDFDWEIQRDLPMGKYQADLFFSVGKKFNLAGLPFTNEIIANSAFFEINSDNEGYVSFDRSETKVNGEKYFHVGSWPSFEKGAEVIINQKLDNAFTQDKEVQVNYNLYYWDSLDEKTLLSNDTEVVTVPANNSVNLEHQLPPIDTSVYYLKITAFSGNQKSIVNLRILSPEKIARLNYPAITNFPLKKGQETTLFTCFHNTTYSNVGSTVTTSILDESGQEIAQLNYNGPISGAMSAQKIDFIPKKDYKKLTLKADIKDSSGNVVDAYETTYDCANFNQCDKESSQQVEHQSDGYDILKYSMYVIFAIIFVGIIAFLISKKRNN